MKGKIVRLKTRIVTVGKYSNDLSLPCQHIFLLSSYLSVSNLHHLKCVLFPQLHEVLEKFLDDDNDMHRLHLTAEEMARQNSQFEDTRKRGLKLTPSGKGGSVTGTVPGSASPSGRKGQGDTPPKVRLCIQVVACHTWACHTWACHTWACHTWACHEATLEGSLKRPFPFLYLVKDTL